jgi:transcription initiation factor TFIID subunit 2
MVVLTIDVRLASLKALVDYQRDDGTSSDLDILMTWAETDPEPRIRHEIVRMLVENPPFDLASSNHLDTEELATRIWNNIK